MTAIRESMVFAMVLTVARYDEITVDPLRGEWGTCGVQAWHFMTGKQHCDLEFGLSFRFSQMPCRVKAYTKRQRGKQKPDDP